MSLINIYVRDKYSGRIHKVGDNQHDMLAVDDSGNIQYVNLQNGDGCTTNHGMGSYEFVPNMDKHGYPFNPMEIQQ